MPWTSTHLHGSASLPQFDGYASDITNPGEIKDYLYPNVQDARTLWYHDHGVHHTAENAYMGLAAQYHLHDSVEDGLPIPKGKYDCPLILADKMFGTDGQFMYDDAGHTGPVGRRRPDQWRAVAEDGGRAAHVPLPGAQRLDLPGLPPAAGQWRGHSR